MPASLTIHWLDEQGNDHAGSLFALIAALARGEVMSLPGLRPHQREPFHAFAVQVGAVALIRAGFPPLPLDEAGWRDLLLALTPGWPEGEAWSLTTENWSEPALLQPSVVKPADKADYRTSVPTPDALDMLVTSRNHDLKAARMAEASDEEWFFALLTLQTTEGRMGAVNFGVSRMNKGYGSRTVFGLRPAGGLSTAWRRDIERLSDDAKARPERRKGLALLWLPPWDGTLQLGFGELDPLYVEICRRVRLRRTSSGRIEALAAGSKVARIAASALKGITGDPWAPIKADGSASVTPTAAGFGYRQFTRLLRRKETIRPLLAIPAEVDPVNGMALVAAALVRGQGKTEGLHRRTVPFSPTRFVKLRGNMFLDRVGEVAEGRTNDAGEAAQLLRLALLSLMQGGPATVRRDDKASEAKSKPWLAAFDRAVDRFFFDETFWSEVAQEIVAPRRAWRIRLRSAAAAVFADAAPAAPRTAERRIRAVAVARNILDGSFRKFVENTADGA